MSDLNQFQVTLSDTDITDILDAVGVINTKLSFLVNLTPIERRKNRNIAGKRAGFASGVYTACTDFSTVVPDSFKLTNFTKQITLDEKLAHVANVVGSLNESIGDTRLLLHSIMLKRAELAFKFLKSAAEQDSSLSVIVEELGAMHTHKTPVAASVVTIAATQTVTVHVSPRTLFYNKGTVTVKFKAGAELASKVKSAFKYVGPGEAVMIPTGWTVIDIVNDDPTQTAIVNVRKS